MKKIKFVMMFLFMLTSLPALCDEKFLISLQKKYQVSRESIGQFSKAMRQGGGTMAQFYCEELGGQISWMKGGMVMVSNDDWNGTNKNRVLSLGQELAQNYAEEATTSPSVSPSISPSMSASSNNISYEYYADTNILLLNKNGQEQKYDLNKIFGRGVKLIQASINEDILILMDQNQKIYHL